MGSLKDTNRYALPDTYISQFRRNLLRKARSGRKNIAGRFGCGENNPIVISCVEMVRAPPMECQKALPLPLNRIWTRPALSEETVLDQHLSKNVTDVLEQQRWTSIGKE
jgi:hypothetical protein